MKHKSFLILIISTLVLALVASARAQGSTPNEVDAPVGNAFTYQGQLKDAIGPVTDSCDFQLSLWDALTNGSQVGSTLTKTNIAVSEGLFTVQLDFGASVFNGNARWLEIAVRCPSGGGAYNTLSPRQPLSPAPYALYSANADTLDGQHASAFQQHAHNLLVVAKSGGDYTTITNALNSITDNSADNPYLIYVAPGIYNETVTMKPYVDIEGAGEQATKITYTGSVFYSTGTVVSADNAELRFLSVENTGGAYYSIAICNYNTSPRLTHVSAIASGATDTTYGVFNYYSSPTMTDVTVSSSGGVVNYSVNNNYGSPKMTNVTVTASDGTSNCGVCNNSSSAAMESISITILGGTDNYAVNNNNSSPAMTNVIATVSGGTNSNTGIYNSTSSPAMTNVIVTTSGGTYSEGVFNYTSSPTMTNVTATASGGVNNYGVWNSTSSAPVLLDVTASASGGTNSYGMFNYYCSSVANNLRVTATGGSNNYGVWNESSPMTIHNSVISASGGTNDGMHNVATSGTYIININNSQISASTSTIYQDSHYTTRVGASQIAGAGAFGGTYVCVASYNGNYTVLDSTCH